MMFRSLAISTSLLALLASGSVMAMEDRDENDRKRNGGAQDSPLGNSSKRVKQEEAKEEKPQPQAINKELNDMIDAAKQGDGEAQYDLGRAYWTCWTEGKWLEAQKYFEEAAQKGDVNSQYEFGYVHYLKYEFKEAKKWLEEAAQKGHVKSQHRMGKIYYIEKDFKEAKKFFEDAAKQGHQKAQFQLGCMLWNGVKAENGQEVVKRDLLGAKKYLEDAAKQGDGNAQFQLGWMLWDGVKAENGQEIVKRDRLGAKKHLEDAAKGGHEKAKAALQELQQQQPQLRPAVPAAVQQNAFDVRSTWKFNPAELRNATEDEIKLYDEIIGKIEGSSITPAEKVKAKNALLRFKTLHANNAAICGELMESPVVRNHSERIYAVTPRDILIHPEQGDANLEQRAHIIHNILETTYAGVKETPISLEKFFKEAFSDTIPCLEAQSRKIDDWRASQESIEIKISRQTIVQNIGEDANQLLEEMKKNSETGKKLIEAQQDYQKFSEKLRKVPNLPAEHPQYHRYKEYKEPFEISLKYISQAILTFEKKHEKWLKNNNKYREMRQTLLATLVGKRAQDGEITENTLNDILSGLGWDFDPQG